MNKVIIDSDNGSGVLPYLPLPELKKSNSQQTTEESMNKNIILIVIVLGLVIGVYNTLFFEQRIQAIVLQFGEPVKVIQSQD